PLLTSADVEPVPVAAVAPERWVDIAAQADEETGDYLFDLGADLVATRLQLRLPQRNTVAPVTWQVRQHQRDDWQDVVHAVVYRLQRDSGEVNSPAIAISRQAGRYWRLRIDSRAGGIGAGTPVLHLGWEPRELVFLARGAPPFTLAYGNRNAVAAQLPLASLLPGYQRGMERTLPVALAGDPHALGGHDAPAAGQEDQPPPDWKRWLLWGILLCAVGLLAFMALALLRKSARS
ncbi:MAG TPA: DUF3999 family protein, partial [Moraxellaceae bacterium]|nr:DUF3999 family protein [Moraxellaceae bacterium]